MEVRRAWYTIAEVAVMFGVSSKTISRWLKREYLPGMRIGTRHLLPKEEIDRMMARSRGREKTA